jgi:hypothetical protein
MVQFKIVGLNPQNENETTSALWKFTSDDDTASIGRAPNTEDGGSSATSWVQGQLDDMAEDMAQYEYATCAKAAELRAVDVHVAV